jgi:hypothetical protein
MTFTYDDGVDGAGIPSRYRKVLIDWTSDNATGAVSASSRKICGRLVKAVTDPGSAAPTANYDIALTDDEGVDLLAACQSTLADRHTANTEQVYFLVKDAAGTPLAQSLHPLVCDTITVSVTNAGNSKTGQIILYIEA